MDIISKEQLIKELQKIRAMGWIKSRRHGNVGGVGNTLEDLLEIDENNLPIPNAAEWELKCQRASTNSLITLFHMEPSPRAVRFVPRLLLPKYGWSHESAGGKYSSNEMSFRQTISAKERSDRGFIILIDRANRKVTVSFDYSYVADKHKTWLQGIEQKVGNLKGLFPQPYWGFDDLWHKAGTKLLNCFYIKAETKKINNEEYFKYSEIFMMRRFSLEGFLKAIEEGHMLIDFDARSGHNHGTKFRLRQNYLPELYEEVKSL